MTRLVIRTLLSFLLLLGFRASTTYAAEMLIIGVSGDGSMKKSDCDVSIVHSELTKGVPKLVQSIYDDLYASCVNVGSKGEYKDRMQRYLGESTGNRGLQEEVDTEEEGGRELMTCYGPCSSSILLTLYQCNNCCLAFSCTWCAGRFSSKPCTLRRRLGTPNEAFDEEMRRLGDAAEELEVSKQCRSDLRKVTKTLNSLGNFCHGKSDQIEVTARLP
jgi:hypothetical protein